MMLACLKIPPLCSGVLKKDYSVYVGVRVPHPVLSGMKLFHVL